MNTESILDDVIRREGGYVDHPDDRGGPTNWGITQRTLRDWRGQPVSADDVRRLPKDEAKQIYRKLYISDPGLSRVQHPVLQALLVDCAVHHGARQAIRWLQGAVGAAADGVLGPKTQAALEAADPATAYREVLARRASLFGQIITRDHSQAAFAFGWMRRLGEFIRATP